ncbi:RepA leader peptide Tap, partial [Escherichia coli]
MPGKVQDFFLCSLLLCIVSAGWGSRDFPSKNDKVLWRPRRLWPPEGY